MYNPIDGRGLELTAYVITYVIIHWFWHTNGHDIKKIIRRWRNVA